MGKFQFESADQLNSLPIQWLQQGWRPLFEWRAIRPKHPAIDGVGLFKFSGDGSQYSQYLVMIQTSLSPYANHESKASRAVGEGSGT